MLNLLVFLSDFRLDNILWVVFLINKGIPFFYIALLEAIFYFFYAVTKHLIFLNQDPGRFLIILSPVLMLLAYVFIYIFNSYILLMLSFILLAFCYYSYHDSLIKIVQEKNSEIKKDDKKQYFIGIIFLSIILSNYFGGLLANISWRLFLTSAIAIKIILILLSIFAIRKIPKKEPNYKQNPKSLPWSIFKNKKILKLSFSKSLMVAIFNFFYIFIAYRLRFNYVSPYHIGLLYSIEALISMIALKYFFHFEALTGSYIGKLITGIAFFSFFIFIFKDSFALIALGFLFISASKYLNESILNMNITYALKTEDFKSSLMGEDFLSHLMSFAILILFAGIYSAWGYLPLTYLVFLSSFIYFALLIF